MTITRQLSVSLAIALAAVGPGQAAPLPSKAAESPALRTADKPLRGQVRVVASVADRRAVYEYRLANRGGMDLAFEVGTKTAKASVAPERVALRANANLAISRTEELQVGSIGKTTHVVRMVPRLRAVGAGARSDLVVGRFDLEVEVRLPVGARVLRTPIPLRAVTGGAWVWKQAGVPVLPPLEIVYTTATERVTLTKTRVETGRDVRVDVVVKNEGTAPIARLDLRGQFPVGRYESDPQASAGEFKLIDGQTYRWSARISLPAGATQTVSLSLVKVNDAPAWDFELRAHDATGDLIAIAPAVR